MNWVDSRGPMRQRPAGRRPPARRGKGKDSVLGSGIEGRPGCGPGPRSGEKEPGYAGGTVQVQVPAQGLWFWQLKVTLSAPQKFLHALSRSGQLAHLPASQRGAGGCAGVARVAGAGLSAGAGAAAMQGAAERAGVGTGAASAAAAKSSARQVRVIEVRFIGSPLLMTSAPPDAALHHPRCPVRRKEGHPHRSDTRGLLACAPMAPMDDLDRPPEPEPWRELERSLDEAPARWDRLGCPRPPVAAVRA